jgi:hypothetical protein
MLNEENIRYVMGNLRYKYRPDYSLSCYKSPRRKLCARLALCKKAGMNAAIDKATSMLRGAHRVLDAKRELLKAQASYDAAKKTLAEVTRRVGGDVTKLDKAVRDIERLRDLILECILHQFLTSSKKGLNSGHRHQLLEQVRGFRKTTSLLHDLDHDRDRTSKAELVVAKIERAVQRGNSTATGALENLREKRYAAEPGRGQKQIKRRNARIPRPFKKAAWAAAMNYVSNKAKQASVPRRQ